MLHLRIQRDLLIGALWLVSVATSASAIPAASAGVDTSHVRMPTVEFVISVEAEIPAAWKAEQRAGAGEFTEAVLSNNRDQPGLSEGGASLAEIAPPPTDTTPGETRVPEPATLVLVGTALMRSRALHAGKSRGGSSAALARCRFVTGWRRKSERPDQTRPTD